ncbi:disulfide bond formation protein B [Deefgea tanakiae]|uniref:Disulfide bond formation protein B n=1 Tax=Deefgea tanakiae TaxID=2865840 RepID=A0ABX8Z9Y3_9NEIS|nr:disulfide bond formation protein B [Deefgea tanakiae]QZA78149.1 disulfide bond formation protein B [Deefgea tanakiae]
MTPSTQSPQWSLIFFCWIIAAISTLGSLFFSEVMSMPPCVLCWYQRIFMYPLLFIFSVGLFPFDARCTRYALPLAISGWLFALYHTLLYKGFIPENLQPCSQGISCADMKLELFGVITIPLLSLVAFSILITLLIAVQKGTNK